MVHTVLVRTSNSNGEKRGLETWAGALKRTGSVKRLSGHGSIFQSEESRTPIIHVYGMHIYICIYTHMHIHTVSRRSPGSAPHSFLKAVSLFYARDRKGTQEAAEGQLWGVSLKCGGFLEKCQCVGSTHRQAEIFIIRNGCCCFVGFSGFSSCFVL